MEFNWKTGCGGAVILVAILALILSFYTVPAGRIGIITRFGAVSRVANPGLGMKIPFIEGRALMDVRTQKDQVPASAASSNIQAVDSQIAVNYHLDPSKASRVYQEIGTNYADVVIAPAIQDVFKATTANFTATQLIQQREKVRLEAEQALKEKLAPYGIIVESFNIVNFDFSKEYNASIEAAQVAQQNVVAAQQRLIQAQVEAQTAVAQAKGQADSQAALKNTGALTDEYLRYLALQKWNGVLPSVTSGAIPFIDVAKAAQSVP